VLGPGKHSEDINKFWKIEGNIDKLFLRQLAYPSSFYLFFVSRGIDALTPSHNVKAFSLHMEVLSSYFLARYDHCDVNFHFFKYSITLINQQITKDNDFYTCVCALNNHR
jgi:hypothetical protein